MERERTSAAASTVFAKLVSTTPHRVSDIVVIEDDQLLAEWEPLLKEFLGERVH